VLEPHSAPQRPPSEIALLIAAVSSVTPSPCGQSVELIHGLELVHSYLLRRSP
jgi:hypothetical protein